MDVIRLLGSCHSMERQSAHATFRLVSTICSPLVRKKENENVKKITEIKCIFLQHWLSGGDARIWFQKLRWLPDKAAKTT